MSKVPLYTPPLTIKATPRPYGIFLWFEPALILGGPVLILGGRVFRVRPQCLTS